jgi:hypothetical protein
MHADVASSQIEAKRSLRRKRQVNIICVFELQRAIK